MLVAKYSVFNTLINTKIDYENDVMKLIQLHKLLCCFSCKMIIISNLIVRAV